MIDQDLLNVIKFRLDFPNSVPVNSWWTVAREDIKTLLGMIEKLQKDIDYERRPEVRQAFGLRQRAEGQNRS